MSDWIGLFGESLASTCMREGHWIQTLSIMDFFLLLRMLMSLSATEWPRAIMQWSA